MISKLGESVTKSKGFGAGMHEENTRTSAYFSKLDQPVFLIFAQEYRKLKDLDPVNPF